MAGTIVYSVVFVESQGGAGSCAPADPNLESWDDARRSAVLSEIGAGLAFWTAQGGRPSPLTFVLDDQGIRTTSCEPITRSSADEGRWISDVLNGLGFSASESTYVEAARSFAHARRTAYGADWAFTIFVVDSLQDADGSFADGANAYAYLNGPFLILTYDNGSWGISRFRRVMLHETAHIFGAMDEYAASGCLPTDSWGYLNIPNASCNNGGISTDVSMMGEGIELADPAAGLSNSARDAVGWRNPVAGAGPGAVVDVVRTAAAELTPFSPDPTTNTRPSYAATGRNPAFPPGGVRRHRGVPYPAPAPASIGRVEAAQQNVDGGSWGESGITVTDGAYGDSEIGYSLVPPEPLLPGLHRIGTRILNSFGHVSPMSWDDVTIVQNATPTPTVPATATSGPLSTGYRDAVLADAPIAYWRLGEGTGQTASEQTGRYPGAYAGGPALGRPGAVQGDSDTAVAFSTGNQYLYVPDAPGLSPQAGAAGRLTVEAWVNVSAMPTAGPGTVLAKGAGGAYEYALRVYPNGAVEIVLWNAGGTTSTTVVTGGGVVSPGVWRHLAGVCEMGQTCRIYVDGVQRAAASTGTAVPHAGDTSAPFTVARRGDGVQPLAATIDEVALYGMALSAARIQAHYAAGVGSASPTPTQSVTPTPGALGYRAAVLGDQPLAYWRLGEGTGTVAEDERGQWPGTYVGGPLLGVPGALDSDSDTAVQFDSTSQYVTVADTPALSPQAGSGGRLSVEAWVKVTAMPTSGPGTILAKGAASGYEYALRVHPSGAVEFVLWAPGGTTYQSVATGVGSVTSGAWRYLVATCDNGAVCRLYVDGALRASVSTGWGSKLPGDSAAPLTIGRRGDNVQHLRAVIDEVAVYGSVLSEAQVQAHYTRGR